MIKEQTKRNNAIEFLRFIFCMGILIFHIGKYLFGEPALDQGIHFALFPHGSLGVEFFFLLSGLLMARSIEKELKRKEIGNLPNEELNFMKNKIKAIFPAHTVAFIISFFVLVTVSGYTMFDSFKLFIDSIPSFFFLQMSGIDVVSLNHVEWYISVMLLVMLVLYPFCKKYYKVFVKLVCPIAALFIIGYLQHRYHSLTGVMVWNGLCYKSVLRGLAEIMLGMFLYSISEEIMDSNYWKNKKGFLTLVEFCGYIFSILIILLTVTKNYEIYVLFALAMSLVLTFSRTTYSVDIFKGDFFGFLGKLTLPLYLSQLSAIWLSQKYVVNHSDGFKLIFTIFLTFMIAMFILCIEEIYKKMRSENN